MIDTLADLKYLEAKLLKSIRIQCLHSSEIIQ